MKSIVVPNEKNDWKLAARFANLSMRAGFKVEWTQEPFLVEGDESFTAGSYVIPLQSKKSGSESTNQKLLEEIAEGLEARTETVEVPKELARSVLSPARVGLFADAGSPFPFASVLSESGFDFAPISSLEIRKGRLRDFDVLMIPGGGDLGPPRQSELLGGEGREKVREFLRSGGSVWGSCAGCCNLILYSSRTKNPWSSNYDEWKSLQSLEVINSDYWSIGMSGVGRLVVSRVKNHQVTFGMPEEFEMTWHLGPFLSATPKNRRIPEASDPIPLIELKGFTDEWTPAEQTNSRKPVPISLDETYAGRAIQSRRYGLMAGYFGLGKVVVCGGHPEFGLDPLLEKWSFPARMISNFVFWATSKASNQIMRRRSTNKARSKTSFDPIPLKRLTKKLDKQIDALIKKSKEYPEPVWMDSEFAASTFDQSFVDKWPFILRRMSELPLEIRREAEKLGGISDAINSRMRDSKEYPELRSLLADQIMKIGEYFEYSPKPSQDYGWQGVYALLKNASEKISGAARNYGMDPKATRRAKSPVDLIWDYYLGALYDLINALTLLRARCTLGADAILLVDSRRDYATSRLA